MRQCRSRVESQLDWPTARTYYDNFAMAFDGRIERARGYRLARQSAVQTIQWHRPIMRPQPGWN